MSKVLRRQFLTATIAFLAAALAHAQQPGKKAVIGYLIPGNPEPVLGYFKEGLRKLGYIEGRDVRFEVRSADGRPERLAGLAAELVRLNVDVLVVSQTPAILANTLQCNVCRKIG